MGSSLISVIAKNKISVMVWAPSPSISVWVPTFLSDEGKGRPLDAHHHGIVHITVHSRKLNARWLSMRYECACMQVKSSSSVVRAIFSACFKIKEMCLRFGIVSVPIVDSLAFSKVKARLGGRVRLVVSGGAPLANHVEKFLKVTMCAPVTQVRRHRSILLRSCSNPWCSQHVLPMCARNDRNTATHTGS